MKLSNLLKGEDRVLSSDVLGEHGLELFLGDLLSVCHNIFL